MREYTTGYIHSTGECTAVEKMLVKTSSFERANV